MSFSWICNFIVGLLFFFFFVYLYIKNSEFTILNLAILIIGIFILTRSIVKYESLKDVDAEKENYLTIEMGDFKKVVRITDT